jgi:hypothetical protein
VEISICEYAAHFSGNALAHIQSVCYPISSAGSNRTQLSPPPLELHQKLVFISRATEVGGFLLDHGDDVIQSVVQSLQPRLEVVRVTVVVVGEGFALPATSR